jgi:enterochelin esterase-like enzyme
MPKYNQIINIKTNNVTREEITGSELSQLEARETAWNNASATRKLAEIKEIRLQKLKETDYYALQDVIMSNEMKAWRLNLRNIPQDYTTEEEYDLLLARDENGNLTHSIWSKP